MTWFFLSDSMSGIKAKAYFSGSPPSPFMQDHCASVCVCAWWVFVANDLCTPISMKAGVCFDGNLAPRKVCKQRKSLAWLAKKYRDLLESSHSIHNQLLTKSTASQRICWSTSTPSTELCWGVRQTTDEKVTTEFARINSYLNRYLVDLCYANC